MLFVWVHCVTDTTSHLVKLTAGNAHDSTVLIRTILICLRQKIVNYRKCCERERKSECTRMCDFITIIQIIVMLTNVINRLSVSFSKSNTKRISRGKMAIRDRGERATKESTRAKEMKKHHGIDVDLRLENANEMIQRHPKKNPITKHNKQTKIFGGGCVVACDCW